MDAAAPFGHGPMREALIEITRQESNERRMDPGIGVEAVHGRAASRDGEPEWPTREPATSPARPTASRQAFQRRCTARRSSPARSSSSLSAADADRAFAGTSVRNRDNAVGFFEDPRELPARRGRNAVQHDGPPEIEAGSDASHIPRAAGAQLFDEQRLDVPGENAARRQLVAIPRLGQERFAPQPFGGALDRLFERQVLEGVQRVVVDEDADGALRRQQVRQLIDHARQGMVR